MSYYYQSWSSTSSGTSHSPKFGSADPVTVTGISTGNFIITFPDNSYKYVRVFWQYPSTASGSLPSATVATDSTATIDYTHSSYSTIGSTYVTYRYVDFIGDIKEISINSTIGAGVSFGFLCCVIGP